MQSEKKSISKQFTPSSDAPVWGSGSIIYAALKR